MVKDLHKLWQVTTDALSRLKIVSRMHSLNISRSTISFILCHQLYSICNGKYYFLALVCDLKVQGQTSLNYSGYLMAKCQKSKQSKNAQIKHLSILLAFAFASTSLTILFCNSWSSSSSCIHLYLTVHFSI